METLLGVKVGSNTLTNHTDQLDFDVFRLIAGQVVDLRADGFDVVLFTSAAVTAGAAALGLKREDYLSDYDALSAMSAAGQPIVMRYWSEAFAETSQGEVVVAQNLITRHELEDDTMEREAFLSKAIRAIEMGLQLIGNENDAISHQEIKFGDNAKLSAEVIVGLMELGHWATGGLIMLTDVDGLYDGHPKDARAKLIREVAELETVQFCAGGSGSVHGSGGMKASLEAAAIVTNTGLDAWIAKGNVREVIRRAMAGEVGTHIEGRQVGIDKVR